jgi:cell division protein FtsZ
VGGISDIIHIPGLVNVDFEDVKTVMSEPGKAMMGTATASGPDRATKAAEAAVACPLLEGIDLSGARGVLVLIAASKQSFRLAESRNAMTTIRRYAAEDAHVIFGTAYDESLGDALRVTVIATGLAPAARRNQTTISVVQTVQRTGTDNIPVLTTALNTQAPQAHQPAATVGQSAHAGLGNGGGIGGQPGNPVVTPQQQVGINQDYVVPSVWRNNRTQAAAKVDALANNGMDEIEIPAFLRKQAD